jgi:hypothetical protein
MRKFTFFMAMILVFLLAAASVYAGEFSGSSWTSAGNMSTKIKGFGERLFLIQFDVHFGPQTVDLVDGGLEDEK